MPKMTPLCALIVVLALLAVSCSSGDSESDDVASDDSAVDALDEESEDAALPSIEGPADPESVRQLAGSLTRADIEGDELTCLVERADGDSQLTAVFNGFGQQGFQFTPEAFTALAVSVHGCVEVDVLNASLLGLSGAADEEAKSEFADCLSEQLVADQTGDLVYTGLAALAVGLLVPQGAQDATIDASRACIGADNLANQLSANGEQVSGFSVEIDRECMANGIDSDFLDSFWADLITNTVTTEGLEPLLASCTSEYDSGLPKEIPSDFVPWSGEGTLAGVDPATRNNVYDAAPPAQLEEDVDYQAVITTDDGEIIIDLFEDDAPVAVNSFVSLVRDGFHDGTRFHRVLDGFMAQAGDPTGTGTGGPGYSFDDEESGLTSIDRRGLLAMANSGPDTNGSQFFITFDAATHLDGLHVVFGEIISGDEILEAIERRDPSAPLSRGELLESIVITEV
jgi:cyclophilin family peptidyl-prolyl cis-trans isomerase